MLSGSVVAKTLVHLSKIVWGCFDAQASSELNDETSPRRHDAAWVARMVAKGRCVTISPRSVWEPASNDQNGLTYIDRRETVQPESYWVPTRAIAFSPAPESASPPAPAASQFAAVPEVRSQSTNGQASAAPDGLAAPAPPSEIQTPPSHNSATPPSDIWLDIGLGICVAAIAFLIGGAWLARRSNRRKRVRSEIAAPELWQATTKREVRDVIVVKEAATLSVVGNTAPTSQVTSAFLGRNVIWYPQGVPVQIAGYTVADGMIYSGTPENRYANEEGCVIDPELPVAASREEPERLGYWPSYRGITPACRRVFLEWLASGKRKPDIDVGYVFLYYYGLERRIILEAPPPVEMVALYTEVERLRTLYASNKSFDGYSRRLLEAAATLRNIGAADDVSFSPDLFAPAGEMPMMLKIAIAREVTSDRPLNFEMAAAGIVGVQEFSTRHPLVLRSGRTAFLTVLRTRFGATFPAGFRLRNRKDSRLQLLYRGATAGLYVDLAQRIGAEKLPDPATLTWTKLLSLADTVAREVEPFVRTVARNPAKAESLAAFVACPTDLAASTAVEARRWLNGLTSPATVSFGELARHAIGIAEAKWTIRHHRQVAEALKMVGRGMEPDPADGSERLEDNTLVQVFESPDGGSDRPGNFRTAAAAAVLVAAVARSVNGQAEHVEELWLEQIPSRLALTADEKMRLMARLKWLRNSSGGLAKTKRLLTGDSIQDREFCAWSASAAVAATGTVTKQQVAMLEAIYDGLGVPRGSLYSALHAGIAYASPAADEPVVVSDETPAILHPIPRHPTTDPPAAEEGQLAKIRAETERVSVLLADIFVDEQAASEPEPELESSAEDPLGGLDVAHRMLAAKLLSRADWPRAEFETLATQASLMPDGAMETINEWAYERLGGALIEDGAMVVVNLDLLPAGAEAATPAN
jgi:hypothetical protein